MNPTDPSFRPQARREGLVVTQLGAEVLAYDLRCHRAHCLNPAASAVWRACDGERDAAALGRELERALAAPGHAPADPEAVAGLVELALQELRVAGLLEVETGEERGVTRRAAVGRLARAAGLAALLPAVQSIVAPEPAEANSALRGSGAFCSSSTQCSSGVCIGAPNGTCA